MRLHHVSMDLQSYGDRGCALEIFRVRVRVRVRAMVRARVRV